MNVYASLKKYFGKRQTVQLKSLFEKIDPAAEPDQIFEDLRNIIGWIQNERLSAKNIFHSNIQRERLLFLLEFLQSNPDEADKFSTICETLIFQSEPLGLFLTTGLQEQQGFLKELWTRTIGAIIPTFEERKNLETLFEAYFKTENDFFAWSKLTPEKQLELSTFIIRPNSKNVEFTEKQQKAIKTALQLLVARIMGIVADPDLRLRLPSITFEDKSFFLLQRYFAQLPLGPTTFSPETLQSIISECREEVAGTYNTLETKGISIDLVYKLESLKDILDRIQLLVTLNEQSKDMAFNRVNYFDTLNTLAQRHVMQNRLRHFLAKNLNMLAKKIVERNSVSGEHYITRTRTEYYDMFASAAGGGLITSFTTLFKVLISNLKAPLFVEGFLLGLNYAFSFIVIQLSHFTLATKTPAVTATTLASRLSNIENDKYAEDFVDDVVAIHRSAVISVLGNLGLVVPGCILIDIIYYKSSGHHILSSSYALEGFKGHNPFTSLTIIYAAFTGAILWASSIMGAWFENWCVYRQQFEILIRSRRLRTIMGENKQLKFVRFIQHNVAGLSTNLFLGFMLAFFSIWGKFFGLPLDVRHVTLATGNLTYCLMAINNMADNIYWIIGAILGIVCIGILNFSVSFTLSLFVATRARNIRLSQFPHLIELIFNRFKTDARSFFIPPKQQ